MAIYEFYCPTCKSAFDRRVPMAEVTDTTRCDSGHRADRRLSSFAIGTALAERGGEFEMPTGGGCACGGGGCGCAN